jgi:hypothetical protein
MASPIMKVVRELRASSVKVHAVKRAVGYVSGGVV